MAKAVGWLRAPVVDAAHQSESDKLWQARLGVAVVEHAPHSRNSRMADPEGNEFTVARPPTPELVRATYGPKGTPG
jgi:hypothetical protein